MSLRKRVRTGVAALLVIGVVFAVGWVQLPYYALGPGPARAVEPLIRVSGRQQFPSEGRFIMTTVRFHTVSALGALVAWLDPNQAVVSRSTLYPSGESAQQETERALTQMDQSKIDATYVVLRRLTRYPKRRSDGALIEFVYPGCPAEGRLFAGDVIRSIDGTAVSSQKEAARALDSAPLLAPISFEVAADGKTRSVSVTRRPCAGSKRPLVGINLIDPFPFDVSISSGDVGGPSAGLMWALGLYDLLTPGDLTGGRTIAGTGTIDTRGRVGPIGGIRDKVVGAERAGAEVFLIPTANVKELNGLDVGAMRLVPVATFQDALDALNGLNGK